MINKESMNESSSAVTLMPGRRSFRSMRELKAKGIYFKPTSRFLNKISFSSYYVFGVTNLMLTFYLTFMKSMIQNSEDVKLLQEKGIIVSLLDDNEEFVRMFKEVDNYAADMESIYDEIKIRMNHHCDSKSRTWIAELINTNFRSPWAVLALLAAAFLLCLTFLQTYYTINPK